MKIFIEPKRIKLENFNVIVDKIENVNFVRDLNDSYDCEALVVGPEFITKQNLDKYPNLKWIQILTAGFDTVDLESVKHRNIIFTNAKGVYSITIAEDVFCKILTINRNVKYYLNNMEKGIWSPIRHEQEIWNSTVGILGTGSIASEIAKRMKAFGAKVIGYRRSNKKEEYFDEIYTNDHGLKEVLTNSDYIIITLPLNQHTYGLINAEKISYMKQDAVLINISRGEVIVQDDLLNALKSNKIRAAGLDVTTPEPLPSEHELWRLDNVFITPHNSPSSPYLSERLVNLLVVNISNYVNNKELINLVNE